MTEEKLRLEIQLEVQKALANLKAAQSDVKKLTQDVKSLGPSSDQTKMIIANLNKEIQSSAKFARLMGNETQALKEQQQALQSAMRQLIEEGLDPQSDELQQLKQQYDDAGKKFVELGDGANTLEGRLGKLAASGALTLMAKQVANFASDSVASFSVAEQAAMRLEMAMRGTNGGAERITQYATELQNLTGVSDDYVKQLAAELAMQGKSEAQIKQLITVAADLSAVTGDDLATSVQELSGTLSGMAGRIGRTIPQLKDLTEEELKAGKAIEIVGKLYAGSAEQMSSTSAVAFRRMQETVGDLSEAIGEVLAPTFEIAANAVAALAGALANAGPIIKAVMGAAVAALAAGLAALAVKAGIAAAAHWTHFAALQAVNAAMAVTNPLLIAGIAAAGAAAVAVTAYAASQANAARAATSAAASNNDVTDTLYATSVVADRARAALDAYRDSLKNKSIEELQSVQSALQAKLSLYKSDNLNDYVTREAIKNIQAQIVIIDQLLKIKRDEMAAMFKQKWSDTWQRYQTKESSDPYAEIELERRKKLEEAAAAYIGKANQAVIDQINAYYDAERRKAAESIALAEREQLAKITETRIDDLELERDKTLATFRGTEAARAQIAAYYDQLIAKTKEEESRRATQVALEAALKAKEFEARLTETQIDDLAAQMERELSLFEGTEEQKVRLAAWYAEKIRQTEVEETEKAAQARVDAMRKAFEKQKQLAAQQGEWGTYSVAAFQQHAAPTEAGKMAGFAGTIAADPLTMLIEAIAEFALSIENVQKVLNPFKTILEGARELLEPLINDALQPLVDVLLEIGRSISQTLSPFISLVALHLRMFASVLQIAMIPSRLLGQAFEWLNNRVMVPFGNAVIGLINGVIKAINWALGWLGVSIPYLKQLKTTEEIASEEQQIKQKMEWVAEEMDRIRELFATRRREIEDAYQKNISSLRKLLEIGAMGEEEYARRVTQLNIQRDTALNALKEEEKNQLAELQKIYDQLSSGINVTVTNYPAPASPPPSPETAGGVSSGSNNSSPLQDAASGAISGAAIGAGIGSIVPGIGTLVGGAIGGAVGAIGGAIGGLFGWWDVGAIDLPKDMPGVVHKGEMIVPATFAEGVRSGKITIGKGQGGTSEVYHITVNVAGSVKTESDLIDAIALGLAKKRSRAILPAGV